EHDEAWLVPGNRLDPFLPGALADDVESGPLEIRPDDSADRLVVFDHDGDAAHGRSPRMVVARRPTWSTVTTSPRWRRRRRTLRPLSVIRVAWLTRKTARVPSSSRIARRRRSISTTTPPSPLPPPPSPPPPRPH